MSKKIVRNPLAEHDLDDLAYYLSRKSLRIALRFLDAAEVTFATLARKPSLGGSWESDNPMYHNMRVWPIKGFENHLIFFRAIEGGIEVIRVLHAARDIESVFAP